MKDKVRKLFKIIFSNKRVLLFSLGLILFLSLVPLHFAQANIFSDILQYIYTLPLKIAGLVAALFLFIFALEAAFLFFIVTNILNWIVGICLTVPIIPTGTGTVVDVGWAFTRDLANMLFILILVFIGLATILKIREYEAKKTLPLLILVAILINFSPVIVGFIVDISNLFTNFFLSKTGGSFGSLANVFNQGWGIIWNALNAFVRFQSIPEVIGNLVGSSLFAIALLIFYGFATAVYCFVIFLLILRIAYLWILMILAPIAFLFYIFPATRKLPMVGWDDWWQNLIKWSIIGIPLGFFLYLSNHIMQNQGVFSGFFPNPPITDPGAGLSLGTQLTQGFAELLAKMIVPFIALLLLYLGTQMAKKLAPEAAIQAIEGIKKGFKVAASVALVAATGGAAAGLAAKGLGGLAKGAQAAESAMGRVPVVGKALQYGVGKQISWATRGMETTMAPRLTEYAAKARRVSGKELEEIDKMSGPEGEAYTNAITARIPDVGPFKKVREQQRLQYMARMADKETLEFTSSEFQKEAKAARRDIFVKENPYFQKEAHSIRKALGDMKDDELVHSKLVGRTGTDRDEKEKEIREEIKKTREITQERLGDEGITIEAGLKLKYITKEEVDKDKVAAAAKAKAKLTAEEITKFLTDTAAAATDVKELKPEDIRKMIDPDTLATRIGLTLGNPRNLQKIQDHFGLKKLTAVIEGAGGLNSATNTPEKLDYYTQNVNPAMAQAIFRSPAYREIDIEARKHMLDPNDQPTTNPDAFERRIEIQKKLAKASPLLQNFNNLHIKGYQLQRKIEDLQLRGKPTTTQEKRLDSISQDIAIQQARIERNKDLRTEWEEIERLRRLPRKKGRP